MTVEDSLARSFVVVAVGAPKKVVQEIFKTQVVFFFFFYRVGPQAMSSPFSF